ncbi:hypothetical protein RF11_03154 [Thelohanellus kitauei]|uniref:Uncharacterized protein n=1 Tax=Thelohanellus kitauei TaxID=669202 RepID=A0A0C2NM42_THEKT|nr:hypothetical protein RF11_03154 [Thelohanellus kitauei]
MILYKQCQQSEHLCVDDCIPLDTMCKKCVYEGHAHKYEFTFTLNIIDVGHKDSNDCTLFSKPDFAAIISILIIILVAVVFVFLTKSPVARFILHIPFKKRMKPRVIQKIYLQ